MPKFYNISYQSQFYNNKSMESQWDGSASKRASVEPESLGAVPRSMWWKERSVIFTYMLQYVHMSAHVHAHKHTHKSLCVLTSLNKVSLFKTWFSFMPQTIIFILGDRISLCSPAWPGTIQTSLIWTHRYPLLRPLRASFKGVCHQVWH